MLIPCAGPGVGGGPGVGARAVGHVGAAGRGVSGGL